jgi:hypothetical protein
LMTATTMTFRCCLSKIPTSTAVSSVAFVMNSTSGCVASAPLWSTPSAG